MHLWLDSKPWAPRALSVVGVLAIMFCTMASESAPASESMATVKRLLLLTHNTFYNHASLEAIEAVVPKWGRGAGFVVTSLEGYKQTASCTREKPCDPNVADLSMIDSKYLAQFDAIMASTNGELPLTNEGKQALISFVRNGKGILFVHQSMVTLYTFKPWGEMLGAYAGRLPPFDTMNADKRPAVLKIEDKNHPATRGLPEHWMLDDEFPQFARTIWDPKSPNENLGPTGIPIPLAFSRERVKVVLSVDSTRTDFAGAPAGWQPGGDYPVAWYQRYGQGRTFYTSLGHRSELWTDDPVFKAHMVGALRWVLGLDK
jgi:type 1 glutamine amidotransferase